MASSAGTYAGKVLFSILDRAVKVASEKGLGCQIVIGDNGAWWRGLRWKQKPDEELKEYFRKKGLSIKQKKIGHAIDSEEIHSK